MLFYSSLLRVLRLSWNDRQVVYLVGIDFHLFFLSSAGELYAHKDFMLIIAPCYSEVAISADLCLISFCVSLC